MNLGEAIRDIRLKVGLTQEEVCKKIKIAQGYYSIIENGRSKPSIDVLEKICDALGVPIYFLFWKATCKRELKIRQRALHDTLCDPMNIYFEQIKQRE